jgi:hypothetical protein
MKAVRPDLAFVAIGRGIPGSRNSSTRHTACGQAARPWTRPKEETDEESDEKALRGSTMSLDPESRTDAERRGPDSIEGERTFGAQVFPDPEELAVDEEANRPRTGEEFLAEVDQEPS